MSESESDAPDESTELEDGLEGGIQQLVKHAGCEWHVVEHD